MFDIGFSELLLTGIVALIVVGPERLPGVIRTTLGYIRQLKAGLAQVKNEVEKELDLEDMQNYLEHTKMDFSDAVGVNELNESLDELRKQSESLREIASDGFEYADSYVSDEEIEADMKSLNEYEYPQLPKSDSEEDTGIEKEPDNK